MNLGDRWMADVEVRSIQAWEQKQSVNNLLSSNYSTALRQLLMHDWMEVASTTSYGNPREYRFTAAGKQNLLSLGEEARNKLEEAKRKNAADSFDEIPF